MIFIQNVTSITGVKPEIFQGKRSFVKLEHLDKHFVKNTRKKQGKTLELFFVDTLKTTF